MADIQNLQARTIPTIVVDCDPGIDDALSLLALAQLVHLGQAAVRCVTAAAGNAPLESTARNAAYVISQSALRRTPVYAGAATPRAPAGALTRGRNLHGEDGLGGLVPAEFDPIPGPGAIEALAAALPSSDITILAQAPLTNVALALDAVPANVAPGSSLVIMGGAFAASAGEREPRIEFNFACDPVAAQSVVGRGLKTTIVPLNVTEQVTFSSGDVRMLNEGANNRLVARLLDSNLRIHRSQLDVDHCYVHDAVALLVLLRPELAVLTSGELSVRLDGERAGQAKLRPTPGSLAAVALEIDAETVKRELFDLWLSSPTGI